MGIFTRRAMDRNPDIDRRDADASMSSLVLPARRLLWVSWRKFLFGEYFIPYLRTLLPSGFFSDLIAGKYGLVPWAELRHRNCFAGGGELFS